MNQILDANKCFRRRHAATPVPMMNRNVSEVRSADEKVRWLWGPASVPRIKKFMCASMTRSKVA